MAVPLPAPTLGQPCATTSSRGGRRRADVLPSHAASSSASRSSCCSLCALLLTSSALNLVASTRAQSPKRAVIVSGPVHSLTDRYLAYARAMADAAEAQGMEVTRIFHPDATPERVKSHANGADLFIYVGHGNGWPSAYGPLDERTKNGLGLDADDPAQRSPSTVVYKGADWLRENIEFAPNAVVILSHLSYASGNASSGMPIPSREVAVERVDNFANGFLASGARVVWALGWQPGADVIDALWGEDATMDAVFMTRYREKVDPINGWVGADPGYYDSVRTPGARVHIDPHPTDGYLRGITGDLDFTTHEWRNSGAAAPDTEPRSSARSASARPPRPWPPKMRRCRSSPPTATASATPSRSRTCSPRTPSWASASSRTTSSCARSRPGRCAAGAAPPGTAAATTASTSVRGASGSKSRPPTGPATSDSRPSPRRSRSRPSSRPPFKPGFFYPSDGDALAATSVLGARLLRPASLSWVIRDASGAVVRRGGEAIAAQRARCASCGMAAMTPDSSCRRAPTWDASA